MKTTRNRHPLFFSRTISPVILVLAFVFVVGCRKESEESRRTDNLRADRTSDLAAVAFAIVDGQPLTAADVKDTVLVNARIAELARRPVKEKKFADWANRTAQHLTHPLVAARLLEKEAKRIGTEVTSADTDKELAKYNRLTRQRAKSLDELATSFGALEPTFRRQFARECLFSAYFKNRPELGVSQSDVETYLHSASNQLALAERVNAEARKRGEGIYERLKRGEPWESVAKETTEDALVDESFADYWKDWTDSPLTSVDFDGIRTNLASLAVGAFSRPIETEEGLLIVKLLGREDESYHCARIFIRLVESGEVPTPERVRRILYQERLAGYQKALLKRLRKEAKIEYPLGTNVTFKIWGDSLQETSQEANAKNRKTAK